MPRNIDYLLARQYKVTCAAKVTTLLNLKKKQSYLKQSKNECYLTLTSQRKKNSRIVYTFCI